MAKKTVDAEVEQKAITTMEIAAELMAVKEAIIEQGGEITEEQTESLRKWNMAIENKAQNIAHLLEKMSHEAALFRAIEDRAAARRRAIENSDKRLREYLASAMAQSDTKSVKLAGIFSITLNDGKPSVHIEDPSLLIIGETVEIVESLKPKADEIKRRLLAGVAVPGASLQYGMPFLTIR